MLTECHETKCAWDHNKNLHKEIVDVFHGSFTRSTAIEALSKKSLTFFIRDNNRIVVCAAYGTRRTETELFLSFITTKHGHRKKGYCTKLLKAICMANFDRIILNVDKNDTEVVQFYKNRHFYKMGDKELKERKINQIVGEETFFFDRSGLGGMGKSEAGVEWYDPGKVDQIKYLKCKKTGRMKLRLRLVHFGWKDEGVKWCLNDLSKDGRDRVMKSKAMTEHVENMYACFDENNKLKRPPDDLISDSNGSGDDSSKEPNKPETSCAISSQCGEINVAEKRKELSSCDTSVHKAAPKDKRLKGDTSGDNKENELQEHMFECDNDHFCGDNGTEEDMSLANRHYKLMEDMENLQYSLDEFDKKMKFVLKK